jgi:hypothetical protein
MILGSTAVGASMMLPSTARAIVFLDWVNGIIQALGLIQQIASMIENVAVVVQDIAGSIEDGLRSIANMDAIGAAGIDPVDEDEDEGVVSQAPVGLRSDVIPGSSGATTNIDGEMLTSSPNATSRGIRGYSEYRRDEEVRVSPEYTVLVPVYNPQPAARRMIRQDGLLPGMGVRTLADSKALLL